MSEKLIPFTNELEKYISGKNAAITSKKNLVKDLKDKLVSKSEEISKKEKEYAASFDDKVFSDIQEIKVEANKLNKDISVAEEQLSLMQVGIMNYPGDINKEINDYVDKLNLDVLREEIIKAKNEYMDKIENYIKASTELPKLKREIVGYSNSISQANGESIFEILRTKNKYFAWQREFDVDVNKIFQSRKELERNELSVWAEFKGGDNNGISK